MEQPVDILTVVAAVVLIVFFLALIGYGLITGVRRFWEELRYINLELERASPREREKWLRRRRRLWLSLLPFYRG